jgi:hypothetical protein
VSIAPLLLVAVIGLAELRGPEADEPSRESRLLEASPCLARTGEAARDLPREGAKRCTRRDMVNLLRLLAGPGAVDCGDVAYAQDRAAALACVAKESKGGAPFFAAFSLQGIDSAVAVGVVRTQERLLRKFDWDSDIFGGGGGPEAAHPSLSYRSCSRIEIVPSPFPMDPFRCIG